MKRYLPLVFFGLVSLVMFTSVPVFAKWDVDESKRQNICSPSLQGSSNGPCCNASFQNERYIPFSAAGDNLVTGDGNKNTDFFLRDLQANTLERISLTNSGGDPNGISGGPGSNSSITDDGRYVLFISMATNIDPSVSVANCLYLRDRTLKKSIPVSVSVAGQAVTSSGGAISPDGKFVIFFSPISRVMPNMMKQGTPDYYTMFKRDLTTQTTTLFINTVDGQLPNGVSQLGQFSGNGQFFIFYTGATNYVTGPTIANNGLYLYSFATQKTIRVDASASGTPADTGITTNYDISKDGSRIVFISKATNLINGDTNGVSDVFCYNTVAKTLKCLTGATVNNYTANEVHISGNGNLVAFTADQMTTATSGTFHNYFYDFTTDETSEITPIILSVMPNYDGTKVIYVKTYSNNAPTNYFITPVVDFRTFPLASRPCLCPRCRRLPSASPLCSPVLAIRHDSGVSLRYTEGHLV